MGREAANGHLGTKNQVKRMLRNLSLKRPNWLRRAGKKMAKAIEKDRREYSYAMSETLGSLREAHSMTIGQ